CLQPMVKPHMTVQQERFDGKWRDLDRLPLEVSGGLDRGVRRDHHRPAAEVVAVDDVVVDIPGHHVMKLVRVEISEIGLGEPLVGYAGTPPFGLAIHSSACGGLWAIARGALWPVD